MKEITTWITVGNEDSIDYTYKQQYQFNDGGRKAANYKGSTSDCVCRSIAIVTGKPYQEVYDTLNLLAENERLGKRKRTKSNSRTGVYRRTYEKYLKSLGYEWIPTMQIGQGCKTHLRGDELPAGRLVVRVSRHITAMIDGVINDTTECSRTGTRCVYGYFHKSTQK